MVNARDIERAPQVLAVGFLLPLVIALVASVLVAVLPVAGMPTGGDLVPETVVSLGAIYTVILPFALAATILLRGAITRTPADIVLGTFAVPCLLVVLWTLNIPNSGVNWGPLLTIGSATLLSLVILADAALEYQLLEGSL